MDSGELAVWVSLFALVVSSISLGWNIYRDVALKARVRVTVQKSQIVQAPGRDYGHFLSIGLVNLGPGNVTMSMIHFRKWNFLVSTAIKLRVWGAAKHLLKSREQGVIMHDYTNPHSGRLPNTMEPGETMSLFLPWDGNENSILAKSPTRMGVSDSYGRVHWASRSQLKTLVDTWSDDFSDGIE